MRLPSKNQWWQLPKILSPKEKIIFSLFLLLFLSSLSFLSANFYLNNTKIVPAKGGEYIEGVVGLPRFINPIYASLSDIDRDLTQLIFSGLMKYNLDGGFEPDIANAYEILEEGRVYEFELKENLRWQDGQPLTVDDVLFTLQTIQNPDAKSPLRTAWLGVDAEKISDIALRFKLKNSSAVFLENTVLKIIPKHIWENIPAQNIPLSSLNLNPVGSGPYKLKNIVQDKEGKITSLDLIPNPFYHDKKPELQKISFRFFNLEANSIAAFKAGEIKGFSPADFPGLSNSANKANLYSFSLPRYFAIFLNSKDSKLLAEKEIRLALNYGTDKEEILNKAISNYGKSVQSPILPDIYGFKEPSQTYQYDIEKAKEILEKAGFKNRENNNLRERFIKKDLAFQFKNNLSFGSQGSQVQELQKCLAKDSQIYPEAEISGYFGEKTKTAVIKFQEKYSQDILKPSGLEKGTGEVLGKTRDKLNEVCFGKPEEKIPLKFSLTTVDQEPLIKVAQIIKEQWQKLGAEIELKTAPLNTLEREIIRKRNFDALLFGEVLGAIPDPFSFWHSSQKSEFGLNLANYENKKADKLLEQTRQSLDERERKEKLEEFQDILIEDAPVIFLYNPNYPYLVSKEIKGIKEGIIAEPSKRFLEIENWYVNTKRVWK